jgi:uncharacterized membrane protein
MKFIQHAGGKVLLLLFSLVGAGIAVYLTTVHYENVPLICSAGGFVDCARVLSSSYSVIPGTVIPITIPGLAWCVVSAILAIVGLRWALSPSSQRRVTIALFIWTLLGMCTVLYLVYVEIVRLHTICAWCTGLHALILLMFLITLLQLQQPVAEEEIEESVEELAGSGLRNQK